MEHRKEMKIAIRPDGAWHDLAKKQGWNKLNGKPNGTKIAASLGLHFATVLRTLDGDYPITHGFVGRVLAIDPKLSFDDVFEWIPGKAVYRKQPAPAAERQAS